MTEPKEINAYYDGIKDGIWMFAYWKDGVQYVGSTGTTLKSALAKIEEERQRVLSEGQDNTSTPKCSI